MNVRDASLAIIACFVACVIGKADAQSLPLDEIASRGATPLTRDEVMQLVSGGKVTWLAESGGERIWTNIADGTISGTRIGTGVGSFNPHHKSSHGKWVVREDGTYCAKLDYGSMLVEGWCWQLFRLNDQLLMHITPEGPGAIGSKVIFSAPATH